MVNPQHQVTFLTPPKEEFESQYKVVRDKENRCLSDDQVKRLPHIDPSSPLVSEWKKRSWMLNKLETYLSLGAFENVLDIGCGNGWMTHKISKYCQSAITGLDVGKEELEQAARCFGSENISFVCCSDWSLLPKEQYDLIYFAGSFHYFEPDTVFWDLLFSLLKPGGEIHILETQFYEIEAVEAAQKRSKEYFEKVGAAVDYYQHLSWDVLPDTYETLYRPNKWNKVFRNRSPFPWIRMRK
ncbi:MAG: class I SAM-dependent methyltransferase [Crocinitomicaceae bacterium]